MTDKLWRVTFHDPVTVYQRRGWQGTRTEITVTADEPAEAHNQALDDLPGLTTENIATIEEIVSK